MSRIAREVEHAASGYWEFPEPGLSETYVVLEPTPSSVAPAQRHHFPTSGHPCLRLLFLVSIRFDRRAGISNKSDGRYVPATGGLELSTRTLFRSSGSATTSSSK